MLVNITHENVNASLGTLYIGTIGAAFCYAFECIFCYQLFFTAKSATLSRRMKIVLAVLFFNDSFGTISNFAASYQYSILHWGNVAFLQRQYWPIRAYVMTDAIAGVIVQTFLALRLWKLSRSIPAMATIGAVGLTALVGAIYLVASLLIYPDYTQREKLIVPVTLWLAPSAGCDVLIALGLVSTLWTARVQVSRFESSALKKPLERLIYTSVETGTVTSVLAVCTLVGYLTDKESNVSPSIGFCLGRAYTLTMIFCIRQKRIADEGSANRPGVGVGVGGKKNLTFAAGGAAGVGAGSQLHIYSNERKVDSGDRMELDQMGTGRTKVFTIGNDFENDEAGETEKGPWRPSAI